MLCRRHLSTSFKRIKHRKDARNHGGFQITQSLESLPSTDFGCMRQQVATAISQSLSEKKPKIAATVSPVFSRLIHSISSEQEAAEFLPGTFWLLTPVLESWNKRNLNAPFHPRSDGAVVIEQMLQIGAYTTLLEVLRNRLKYRCLPAPDQISRLIRGLAGSEAHDEMWKAYLFFGYYGIEPTGLSVYSDLVAADYFSDVDVERADLVVQQVGIEQMEDHAVMGIANRQILKADYSSARSTLGTSNQESNFYRLLMHFYVDVKIGNFEGAVKILGEMAVTEKLDVLPIAGAKGWGPGDVSRVIGQLFKDIDEKRGTGSIGNGNLDLFREEAKVIVAKSATQARFGILEGL